MAILEEFDPRDLLDSFIQVTKKVLLRPRAFFWAMPTQGGFFAPMLYLVLAFSVWAVLKSLVSLNPLFFFVAFLGFLFTFLGAAILHFVLRKLFNGQGTYEGTFRVLAYSGAVNLLSWIPIIGVLVNLYGLWIKAVGLEVVHGVTKLQSLVAVIICTLIFWFIMLPLGGFILLWP